MRTTVGILIGISLLLTAAIVPPSVVPPPAEHLQARLDGASSIAIEEIHNYHCHDGRYPVIDCFKVPEERDRDAARASLSVQERALGISSNKAAALDPLPYYVTFYEHQNYGGASYTTWRSIANLSSIHWNDIISSFKSLSGEQPRFWKHADWGYPWYQWAAGSWVSYVGDPRNDQFSAVDNP